MCDKSSKLASFGRFISPIVQGAAAGAASVGPPRVGGGPGFGASLLQGFGAASKAQQQQGMLKREMEQQDVDRNLKMATTNQQMNLAQDQLEQGRARAKREQAAFEETQAMRKSQTDFLKNPAGIKGLLAPLGELTPSEQVRMDAAQQEGILTNSTKPITVAVDDIYTRRSVESGRPPIKGDILESDVARQNYPNIALPKGSLFVRVMKDRAGKVTGLEPTATPAGARIRVSNRQQVVFDDQGQMHIVNLQTTSRPVLDGPNPDAIADVRSPEARAIRGSSAAESEGTIRKLPASAKAKLDTLNTIKDDVRVVKELLPKYGEYVGFGTGLLTSARVAGAGTKDESMFGVPPEVVDLFAVMQSLQDRELRARSGAQINEQEMKRLVRFLPDPNRSAAVNVQRLAQFEREIDMMISSATGKGASRFNASKPLSPIETGPGMAPSKASPSGPKGASRFNASKPFKVVP